MIAIVAVAYTSIISHNFHFSEVSILIFGLGRPRAEASAKWTRTSELQNWDNIVVLSYNICNLIYQQWKQIYPQPKSLFSLHLFSSIYLPFKKLKSANHVLG